MKKPSKKKPSRQPDPDSSLSAEARRILYFRSTRPCDAFTEACLSLTPHLAVHACPPGLDSGPELYLDIASTRKTFGGEARLLLLADELIERFGWEGEVVITDRPEWAAALSLSGSECFLPGKSFAFLLEQGVDRLIHLGDPVVRDRDRKEREALIAFLNKVGVRTIGQFLRLGEAEITLRFGRIGRELHSWMSGTRELRMETFVPPEKLGETLDTDVIGDQLEGADGLSRLLFSLRAVCARFEARLRGRALLARKITLQFFFESGPPAFKQLELSAPLQESAALLRLLHDFLRDARWSSPLRRLEIEVTETCPYVSGQLDLFDESENRFTDLNQYVSRLRARFGADAVGIAEPRDSHLPERSWTIAWPPPPTDPTFAATPLSRPLFLFTPPRPCTPPRGWNLTQTENLVVEWWEDTGSRSYFLAENPKGERLWVFFDAKVEGWFLQGTFD